MDRNIAERLVRHVMTWHPLTVRPETGLEELQQLFTIHGFKSFPVVDAGGRARGMVTQLDLLRALRPSQRRWLPDIRALFGERVEDIMRRGILAVEPNEPVTAVIDLMVANEQHSVLVVETRGSNSVVGIVTPTDLLKCIVIR